MLADFRYESGSPAEMHREGGRHASDFAQIGNRRGAGAPTISGQKWSKVVIDKICEEFAKSRQDVVIGDASRMRAPRSRGFRRAFRHVSVSQAFPLQEVRAMRHVTISASRTYWREIAALLAAKVVALLLIYFLFFAAKAPVPPVPDHLFNQSSRR